MRYQSLYRKWRPQVFEDIIGQRHITQTLMNAISLNRISHGYVFSGPRGVGKTTTARILAKGLNCEKGPTAHPCNKCESCIRITNGYSMDVIEIDGASNNGVDNIRELRNKVKFAPAEGRYKVYIIDEVHMLSTGAFNALLKTLEEPPAHVVFVLATTDPHKIPNTILSRCQCFDFRRIPVQDIIAKLKIISKDEEINIDDRALNIIARNATGSMRDAESTLDQVIAYCDKEIDLQSVIDVLGVINEDTFYDLTEAIIKNDTTKGIEIINQISDLGGDPSQFTKDLMEYIHNLSLVKVCSQKVLALRGIFEEDNKRLVKQSNLINLEKIFSIVNYLAEVEKKMGYTHHPWILLEMFVIKFTAGEEYSLIGPEKDKRESVLQQPKFINRKKLDKEEVGKKEETNFQERIIQNKIKETIPIQNKEISTNLDLTQVWSKILNKIKKTRISVYSFIIANNLITIEDDTLIIGFNKKFTFHKENLEKKNNKILLQKIIKEETGRLFTIKCIINNQGDSFLKRETKNINEVRNEKNDAEKEIVENKNNNKKKDYKLNEDDTLLKESLDLFKGKIVEG
jgi:DNA polymerase-3 subunit gamma/tau